MVRRLVLPLLLALLLAPCAHAAGGRYRFDGGTRAERAQVVGALAASSFDWSVVPGSVLIHIASNVSPHGAPGEIWLDARLLDTGRFAWGVVQHEYAHQVDFLVLTDAMRAQLHGLLGGESWWGAPADHVRLDCERFADAVAWAYWPSPDNVIGAQAAPAGFRAVLTPLLPASHAAPRGR